MTIMIFNPVANLMHHPLPVALTIQVPFCEEKSVQLVRAAFFRSDLLQNPYFKIEALLAIKNNEPGFDRCSFARGDIQIG